MKGLVLEGGAMRGVFTAGVLDAFLDLHITFDHCTAISAGALNAISYLSKQKERNLRVMRNYQTDPRYISFHNWITTGSIFGMKMILETIPEELDPVDHETYKNNPCKLYAGVFDVETGELSFHHIADTKKDKAYLQAASSLPLLGKMVTIDGRKYLDGGIADCFGLDFSIQSGCDKIIVVHTRDKEYRRTKEGTLPLIKMVYHKYPMIAKYIAERDGKYNQTVRRMEKMEEDGKLLLLRPIHKVTVSRTEKDQEKLYALYKEGYDLVMQRKDEIIKYLES